MAYDRGLKLQLNQGQRVVIYENGRDQEPLLVRLEKVSIDGEVTLGFSGDRYRVWREEVYQPGRMQRDER
jgi:hypothetical protein